jgi:hypothetical protein
MKWSSDKISDLKKSFEGSLNINQIMRDFRISSIVNDTDVPKFPFQTDGNFVKNFLRTNGIEFEFTNEELLNLHRLKYDPLYLSTFIKIVNGSGWVNFDLYPNQIDFVSKYPTNKFNLIKHSRQVGMTHMLSLITLHYSIIKSDKNILWISNNWKEDYDRFMRFLSQLPFYILPGISIHEKSNSKSIDFENGNRIKFSESISNTSTDLLIVDNAGYTDLHKILTMVIHRLSSVSDTQCFISSSPASDRSHFERLYSDKSNYWNKTIINWDTIPERDSKWVTETSHLLGGFQNFLNEYHVDDSPVSLRDLKIDLLDS